MTTLFNIGHATIDVEHITAIWCSRFAKRSHYVRCDGQNYRIPDHPEGLVDDLFEAWEKHAAKSQSGPTPAQQERLAVLGKEIQSATSNHRTAKLLAAITGRKGSQSAPTSARLERLTQERKELQAALRKTQKALRAAEAALSEF